MKFKTFLLLFIFLIGCEQYKPKITNNLQIKKEAKYQNNGFALSPGRYVGAPEEENDGEPFDEKMKRLTSLLKEQQEEGTKLDLQIAKNLQKIGYE